MKKNRVVHKTEWIDIGGNYRKLHWVCDCGLKHPLDKGKFILTCPCGEKAAFNVG